ncbi:hypothetical protein JCM3765_002447 [Sporobolomyces pararoseus]
MSRPTLLSTLLPSYLPNEDLTIPLEILTSHGISTDVDLVFGPRSLPPNPSLSPQLYSLLRSFASSNLSAPSTSGNVIYSRRRTLSSVSTTIPALDKLLGNKGYFEGELVELVGTTSSGRTILALYASLNYLLQNPSKRGAYLDTTGKFDPFRCLSILKEVLIPRARAQGKTFPKERSTNGTEDEKAEEKTDKEVALHVLDRLSVSKITKSGQALDKIVGDQSQEGHTRLGVVVIDQVDDLLGESATIQMPNTAQAPANLIAFTRRLASLAKSTTSPFTVFLINSLIPCAEAPRNSSAPTKSPAIHLVPSNPQPPPVTSLPLLTAVAPNGLMNALDFSSSESWSNLIDLSLVCLKSEDVFSSRGVVGGEGGGPTGSSRGGLPSSTARRKEMIALVEVGKNSRGIGGSGQLVGIKLENGVKLTEI